MDQPVALYRSSVGKKVLMAVTGLFLLVFLIGHMVGNLKAFLGPEAFNEYAEFLREMGEPAVPRGGLLWIARILLLASVGVHIVFAIQLWRKDKKARNVGYRRFQFIGPSNVSQTMLWGGVTIFAFVVYHLLHLTFGAAHPDFQHGAAYHNLVVGFANPIVAIVYILAMIPLGMHLYHGFWAAFQSLGTSNPRLNRDRRGIAAAISLIIVLGFIAVPLGVLFGILEIGA